MASQGLIKIEGLQELQRKLLALPKKLQGPPTRGSLMSGAKLVKDRARDLVAEDTGFLREAIIQYPVRKNEHRYTDQVRIGVRKRVRKGAKLSKKYASGLRRRRARGGQKGLTPRYWRFLEFGTSRMAARPFLRPAFEREKEPAAKRIEQRMRQEIEKAASHG